MSAGGIAVGIHPQLLSQLVSSDVPANAITTDTGDAITLDDGTTFVVQD
mgnify:FL=1